jgi:signal peptidase
MKRPNRKVYDNSLVYIILGVILALGINWGLALALSTDMPVVAVESYSMVPTFTKGDILVLQGTPVQNLKVGDIIVFSPSLQQTPVVHRIVEINTDGTFQTRGDANNGQLPFEKSISASQVHGKAILIIPYLGWLKLAIMEYVLPNWLWLVVGGSALVFIYMGIKFLGEARFFG